MSSWSRRVRSGYRISIEQLCRRAAATSPLSPSARRLERWKAPIEPQRSTPVLSIEHQRFPRYHDQPRRRCLLAVGLPAEICLFQALKVLTAVPIESRRRPQTDRSTVVVAVRTTDCRLGRLFSARSRAPSIALARRTSLRPLIWRHGEPHRTRQPCPSRRRNCLVPSGAAALRAPSSSAQSGP